MGKTEIQIAKRVKFILGDIEGANRKLSEGDAKITVRKREVDEHGRAKMKEMDVDDAREKKLKKAFVRLIRSLVFVERLDAFMYMNIFEDVAEDKIYDIGDKVGAAANACAMDYYYHLNSSLNSVSTTIKKFKSMDIVQQLFMKPEVNYTPGKPDGDLIRLAIGDIEREKGQIHVQKLKAMLFIKPVDMSDGEVFDLCMQIADELGDNCFIPAYWGGGISFANELAERLVLENAQVTFTDEQMDNFKNVWLKSQGRSLEIGE